MLTIILHLFAWAIAHSAADQYPTPPRLTIPRPVEPPCDPLPIDQPPPKQMPATKPTQRGE